MAVQRQGSQRGDENLEFQLIGHLRGEFGVQAMDTLNDEDGVLAQLEVIAVPNLLALGEVEGWDFHLFACQQPVQRAIE